MNRWKRLTFILSILLNVACALYFIPKLWRTVSESQIPNPKHSYWMDRDQYFELLPEDSLAIVFVGTSITHNFELEEAFKIPHLQNRGINGDDLNGMLRRLDAVTRQNPRAIFFEAGINDLGDARSEPKKLKGLLRELIEASHTKTSGTSDLLVLSLLPVSNRSEEMPEYCSVGMNRKIVETNAHYKDLCETKGLIFIDVHKTFTSHREMNPKFTTDGVHLSGEGYMKLAEILRPYVERYQ
jgi:lysophospholipase L1-like esterase